MDEPALRRAAQAELQRHGPLFVDDLWERIDPALLGDLDPDDLGDLLEDEWDTTGDTDAVFVVWPLADDRLCDLDHLLDGMVLTHRLDDDRHGDSTVTTDPDLSLLWFSVGLRVNLSVADSSRRPPAAAPTSHPSSGRTLPCWSAR